MHVACGREGLVWWWFVDILSRSEGAAEGLQRCVDTHC